MGKVIAICNPKGGTAKTSTAVNLACAFTTINKKVLLVDFDPQRSASVALGYEYADVEHNIATCIFDNVPIDKCITPYLKGGFDVVLSSDDLVALPTELKERVNPHLALYDTLKPIVDKYDYIIIDTPATLNFITQCALCACDYLLITVSCDLFAIDSMYALIDKYASIKIEGLAHCNLVGIIRTLYDKDQPLSKAISFELEQSFKELLFKTFISYNQKISESSSAACPILIYDRTSTASIEYLSLCGEFIKKIRKLAN